MKRIEEMSDEEINVLNETNMKKNAKDFKEFKKDLEQGKCWVCKKGIDNFDVNNPCQHWLLLPKGIRKKHLKIMFDYCTFDKLEGFLRWYVNAKNPLRHINDLSDEHDRNLLRGLTIQYDNTEWSLYFGKSCIKGKDGSVGPHYHFQIKVDGKLFHSFSNRHIKLSDYELWQLGIDAGEHPKIKRMEIQGAGIQDVMENLEPEQLLDNMKATDDYDNASFHISSVVMADEGHTISGDDIADIIKESKETGVPMHRLIKRLQNVRSQIIVEPGPGIPEAFKRKRHRGKNKKRPKTDN